MRKMIALIALLTHGALASTPIDDLIVENSCTLDYATASRAAVIDSGKVVTSSSVTSTELGYLSGVTSAIQTQLNGKEPTITTLPIAKGGTGQATANAALNALLPSQSSHVGEALFTNGTDTHWQAAAGSGTVTNVSSGDGSLSVTNPATTPDVRLAFPINGGGGSAGSPTYSVGGAGMYSVGYGTIDFSTLGTLALEINNNQQATFTSSVTASDFIYPAKSANTFLAGPTSGGPAVPGFRSISPGDIGNEDIPFPLESGGSVASPAFSTGGGGMYGIGFGVVGFSTLGTERIRIENNGSIEIGHGGSGSLTVNGPISASNFPPVGTASTPAWFDGSGVLGSPPGWSYNSAYGTFSGQTLAAPADAGDVNYLMYGWETEINPVQDTSQFHPTMFNFDTHFDRTGTGEDMNDVKVFNGSFTQEGDGNIKTFSYWNHNISLGNGTAGSLGGAGASSIFNESLGINANYVATDLINFQNRFVSIDAAATVGDFNYRADGINGNIGGNFQGLSLVHNGDLALGGTENFISHNGSLGGNYIIQQLQHNGNSSTGMAGEVISIEGTFASGNVDGQRIAMPNGNTQGKFGQSIFMGGGVASGNSIIWAGDFQGGTYNSKLGLNINMGQSGGVTNTLEKGIQVQESVDGAPAFVGLTIGGSNTATSGTWVGLEVNSGTSAPTTSQVGLTVNLSGSPELTLPARKQAASFDGGLVTSNYETKTISSHPFTIDGLNNSRVKLTVDSGTPITGTDVGANIRSYWMDLNDDITVSAFGLGQSIGIDEFFLGVASGKTQTQATFQTMVPIIGGAGFGLPSGGTLDKFSYVRPLAPLSLGGSLTINTLKVFHIDTSVGSFSSAATNAWGFINEDDGLENYMGKLAIGTSSKKVASGVKLEVHDGHFRSTQTTAPTATPDANAGTGATCTVSAATDTDGRIELVTGTLGWAAGSQCLVTFNQAYNTAPICQLTAKNAAAAVASTNTYSPETTTDLSISFVAPDVGSNTYDWTYHCAETQ